MFPVPLRSPFRTLTAIAAALLLTMPADAQDAPPVTDQPLPDADGDSLDPDAPLTPLPDLGVDWPDVSGAEAPPGVPARPGSPTEPQNAEGRALRYQVILSGLQGLPDSLRTRFNELSTLKAGEDKPANTAQIDRRAREDETLLRDLLRAYGHYAAEVTTGVEAGAGDSLTVSLGVEPGPVYNFSSVSLEGVEKTGAKAEGLRRTFGVAPGDPVNADAVAGGQARLKEELGQQGFPFARVGEPQVTVDHDTRTAMLTMDVDPGGAARFGRIVTHGKPIFTPEHLAIIARFRPGTDYDAALIEDFRRALIATSLVSSVRITPVPAAEPGVVDIAVRLEPAPKRTIAGELGYGTGEGIRAEVSWQHRNLIKPEGAVTFRGVAGTREQLLGASLRRSNFRDRDQVLTAQLVASHTNLNAYDARTFTLAAGLERQTNIIWQKNWTWSLGAELLTSDERDTERSTGLARRRTFVIGALPTNLAYDGSDNLLDPTRGWRLAGRVSPEVSFQNSPFGYARVQLDGSAYLPMREGVTIAGRVRLGSIVGASRDRIAPSRRFYSGGGGSVRGYGYQDIGPKDANGDPVGGRSLAEFALEARVRFGDFGIVPFIDAGNLYTSPLPALTNLRYGAGLGVRYHTSFGPIRVDVGTPLNRRPGDSRIAVYVSLGQAF
ncbi:hypothetical protein CLG96_12205 [Sphingomonas oleivorans]|uniref:Bacterial surface antigen (D15) domain-containing protein n=1 Tax=Sphingomonas oleivorans TaxID=1735121 RepID=A0A2T5FWZ5_9SPHN|nr:BamA/TamA family outer membrane protein [Sphingomonas oleivorans]PTQ10294.1 hypothetical protein CLG96_12205 [Sphingomonas oleivorans]